MGLNEVLTERGASALLAAGASALLVAAEAAANAMVLMFIWMESCSGEGGQPLDRQKQRVSAYF